jgi:peptidoglycan/LPS O-acetylase OafA/YrhL
VPAPDELPSARRRIVGLDLLRLLAVTLVLGRHLWDAPVSLPRAARIFFAAWQRGGWVGVDLFFVLSGFLVSGLLFTEFRAHGRISPLRFYARRAWKIYPPYLVMIAVTTGAILAQGFIFQRIQLVAEVLFFQNYVKGLWNHTWSLAVEEHFYLLLPLLCLLVLWGRRGRARSLRGILVVGGAVAAVELALRVAYIRGPAVYMADTHLYQTHLRLDSLFFGVMLSYAHHFHRERFERLVGPRRWLLLIGGVMLLAPAFVVPLETSALMYTVGLTAMYLGSGLLVMAASAYDTGRSRIVGALAAVGAFSYSIYLWHMPFLRMALPVIEEHMGGRFGFGARTALYLGGSVVVGIVMARLVEVPALRLRDQRHPSLARRPARIRASRSIETPVASPAVT